MKLLDLLQSAGLRADPVLSADVLASEVTRVTADSREVGPGALFVAVRGGSADGHAFVEQAVGAGAVAVVGEEPWAWGAVRTDERYLGVPSTRQALGDLASALHGHPSRSLLMIGVTGTSGKTTTTYLIESILRASGRRTGLIGTVNFRFEGTVLPSTHTTPGAPELQALLAKMRDLGADAVVMEVSSHALKQRRVAGTAFDGMVFTNLSPEHLDFHPDMDDYYASKKLLFTELAEAAWRGGKRPRAAINADDAYGARLLRELGEDPSRGVEFVPFSAHPPATDARMGVDGITGAVEGVELRSPLVGGFNVSNLAAAVAVAREVGIPAGAIAAGAASLPVVPGRLQRVPDPRGGVHVLVDYAHKPDALEKVLRTLGEMRQEGRRLITVFGCGGDRDRTKRPVMGRIAVTLSDRVFITSDNPRSEDPAAIVTEIVAGTGDARNFEVEVDRRRAIFRAVTEARPGDLVVIAGKGHEDYQIVRDPQAPAGTQATVKLHFDDREVAAEALAARKD